MNDTPRSSLIGKVVQYVGFIFDKHPLIPNHFAQISVYKIKDRESYVLCVSQGMGSGDIETAKAELGDELAGENIMNYAARHIDFTASTTNFDEFKKILEKSRPGKWYWHT